MEVSLPEFNETVEVTFAKLTDGKRECTYWVRHYTEKDSHVSYYTIARIWIKDVEEIKNVTTERLQDVLSKYI